ncbi:hypothetical protein [Brachybacterium squillarum]|uniref:hypothetical protein n=1 Tax=Brachybacterium squillarum TaxID=661979 RepID=UPI0022237AA3|nr:hypothetical protein [Brachybacterium squillarum]MCW1803734.1 hypothetical protein [Brachybacterium squillarum]
MEITTPTTTTALMAGPAVPGATIPRSLRQHAVRKAFGPGGSRPGAPTGTTAVR